MKLERVPLPRYEGALDEESEPTRIQTEEIRINMGPQHPSTHGVLRLVLTLYCAVLTDSVPLICSLPRAPEKLAERHTYPRYITHTDRWDYLDGMANNQL